MTFRLYIGWDPLDTFAFEVAAHSILKHASVDVDIIPLNERFLRKQKYEGVQLFSRPFMINETGQRFDLVDHKPCSTEFSFTRFLVPILEDYGDEWVGFIDADMLFRADIAGLIDSIDDSKALMCVKHNYNPPEENKMLGQIQVKYFRKNWSSVYLMKPSRNKWLTPYTVNRSDGSDLQRFRWLQDDEIGALEEKWNWLCGWSSPDIDPCNVHFTRGTPDLDDHKNEPFADEWWREFRETGLNMAAFPITNPGE